MANTEGMSDEALEALFGEEPTMSSLRLNRRMDLPMGDRPAAKVVRFSKNRDGGGGGGTIDDRAAVTSSISSSTPPETVCPPPTAPIVMGNIVERRPRRSPARTRQQRVPNHHQTCSTTSSTITRGEEQSMSGRCSRFSAMAQKTGFPSVLEPPLGSLVKNRQRPLQVPGTNPPSSTWSSHETTISKATAANTSTKTILSRTTKSPALMRSAVDAGTSTVNTVSSEAERMLSEMSLDEIQENIRDLHSQLSPTMIAFLQQRGQQKSKLMNPSQANPPPPPPVMHCIPSQSPIPEICIGLPEADEGRPNRSHETFLQPPITQHNHYNMVDEDCDEKDRLAKLLSSIQSYEEMDAVIAQEGVMGLELGRDLPTNVDDQFLIACDLLRSTVRRQNVWAARFVHQRVEEELLRQQRQQHSQKDHSVQSSSTFQVNTSWSFPTLLPVSLRCLLDVPSSSPVGRLLQTYALQSLHTLLQLLLSETDYQMIDTTDTEACSCSPSVASLLYQEYFLDDAVPTASYQYAECALQPLCLDGDTTVAYSTAASTTSAQKDGVAFLKDPLWTLLSQMRIIPRVSQLLLGSLPMPREAILATCGILSLIAQRSPGAASAIARHPSLIANLTEIAISVSLDADMALSMLLLQCTLTRQSRAAAEVLTVPLELIVPPTPLKLQRWVVIQWRSRLRYGLSLQNLEAMLTLAARHFALAPHAEDSLAPDFFSALSVVLHCIQVCRTTTPTETGSSTVIDRSLLEQAAMWLPSTKRQAFGYLSNLRNDPSRILGLSSHNTGLKSLHLYAAVFQFLDSWIRLNVMQHGRALEWSEFKFDDMSEKEEQECLATILVCLQAPEVQAIFCSILQTCLLVDLSLSTSGSKTELTFEAVSCAFVKSILDLATNVATSTAIDEFSSPSVAIVRSIRGIIISTLRRCVTNAEGVESIVTRCASSARSRVSWLNLTHTSLVRFLASLGHDQCDDGLATLVLLAVVGRLDAGDESLATYLFSCDRLLESQSFPRGLHPSPLSSFFVRELCISADARNQLDHSFKLRNGLGISSNRLGPFELQSLRSSADGVGSGSGQGDLLLPMGPLWIWKIFSGRVVDPSDSSEAIHLLASALRLACDIESLNTVEALRYRRQFSVGGRLYFTLNICLQPPSILADSEIQKSTERLLSIYVEHMNTTEAALFFAQECEGHSMTRSKTAGLDNTRNSEEVSRILGPLTSDSDHNWPTSRLNALKSFAGDMCETFLEYGAQYMMCRKCLRLLLAGGFPSSVRCEVIQRLRGALHLLSYPEENEDEEEVCFLKITQVGIDPPDIIDAAALLLTESHLTRLNSASRCSFITLWAVGTLVRSIASCIADQRSLIASKRRIEAVGPFWTRRIMVATERFFSSTQTIDELVSIIVNPTDDTQSELAFPLNWEQAIEVLRKNHAK